MNGQLLSEMSVGQELKPDERLTEANMDDRINTLRETVYSCCRKLSR